MQVKAPIWTCRLHARILTIYEITLVALEAVDLEIALYVQEVIQGAAWTEVSIRKYKPTRQITVDLVVILAGEWEAKRTT